MSISVKFRFSFVLIHGALTQPIQPPTRAKNKSSILKPHQPQLPNTQPHQSHPILASLSDGVQQLAANGARLAAQASSQRGARVSKREQAPSASTQQRSRPRQLKPIVPHLAVYSISSAPRGGGQMECVDVAPRHAANYDNLRRCFPRARAAYNTLLY